jgi:hypothetical protein
VRSLAILTTLVLLAASATLAWQAPHVGTLTQYILERQVQGQPWQVQAVVAVPVQQYTDPATVQGLQCYRVRAQNATMGSTPSEPPVCLRCNPQRCRQE